MGRAHARRTPGAPAVNDAYLRTARLLTQVAPSVFTDDTFALKSAAALRNMSRSF